MRAKRGTIATMYLATQKPSRRLALGLLALLLGVGFAGCATTGGTKAFSVQVDAVSDPSAPTGWSYVFSGARSAQLQADSRYAGIVSRVQLALSQRGMYEAPSEREAIYVITFDYGERAQQAQVRTSSQPVMVQPGPFSGVGGTGGVPQVGIGSGGYPGAGSGVATPQVVMVPTTEVVRTSEKYFIISARGRAANDPTGRKPMVELWRVEAVIEDESSDIYTCLPALIDAVVEYMGGNTGGPTKIVVRVKA